MLLLIAASTPELGRVLNQIFREVPTEQNLAGLMAELNIPPPEQDSGQPSSSSAANGIEALPRFLSLHHPLTSTFFEHMFRFFYTPSCLNDRGP